MLHRNRSVTGGRTAGGTGPSAEPLRIGVLLLHGAALLYLAAGCTTKPGPEGLAIPRFYLESTDPHATEIVLPVSGVRLPVSANPVFSEADIVNVELVEVDLGHCLLFQFTPEAARALHRVSGSHQGRRLVLTINGQPVGVRIIDAPFASGNLLTFTELPDEHLVGMAVRLKKSVRHLQKKAG